MASRSKKNSREIIGVGIIAIALLVGFSLFGRAGFLGAQLELGLKWGIGSGRYLFPLFLFAAGLLFFTKDPAERLEKATIGFIVLLLSVVVAIHINVAASEAFEKANLWRYGGLIGAGFAGLLKRLVGVAGSYVLVTAAALGSMLFVTGLSLRDLATKVASGVREQRQAGVGKQAKKPSGSKQLKPRAVVSGSQMNDETVEIPRPSKARRVSASKAQNEAAKLDQLPLIEEEVAPDGYRLPPTSLLKKSPPAKQESVKHQKEQTRVLEQTLLDFDIVAQVERVISGPTVTRFELQLASGIKVNRIVNLADDIALALASADIRVLAPIPGKSAVGIEIPKLNRELVTLGDVLEGIGVRDGGPLSVPIGKDIAGKTVMVSIAEMPHLLIAGATGSGKSVCVNGILMSILLRARPDQVKLILIDPKRVELNLYNDVPHLLVPVITGPKEAAKVLSWAVGEMEARYQLLSDAKVRNIAGYNELVNKEAGDREPLPFIVIIIDELADLMMVAAGEVEDAIVRLSQMARAVGIHLLVATQRPSANIITGLIKANITCRVAFAVSSQVDSRVVLDVNGAEKLIGKGDMLFMASDSPKARRLQAPYVAEGEVELVTEYAKQQAKPEYKREILAEKVKKVEIEFTDELFDEALDLIVNTKQASTSSLQRRLRVGYARAARLIDMMEQRGMIGPADGSKPRELLITREELDELRGVNSSVS